MNNGIVYLSWGAPCHQTTFDYSGWVMAYNEGTLEQLSVLDLTPNGSGGGVWMSGAGPAGDANGNVFLTTSTGTFDTTLDASGKPKNGDYGNGYLKIQSPNGVMTVYDYFEPLNGVPGAANYADQGSGGIMLTPGSRDQYAIRAAAGNRSGQGWKHLPAWHRRQRAGRVQRHDRQQLQDGDGRAAEWRHVDAGVL